MCDNLPQPDIYLNHPDPENTIQYYSQNPPLLYSWFNNSVVTEVVA